MFKISIQSPFTSQPVEHDNCTMDKAAALYQQIDWEALYIEIENTGDSPESPFYFYEISKKTGAEGIEGLLISGCYEDKVMLTYYRPKIERKGFFTKKDVLNPKFITHMDEVDLDFANTCFLAFISGDINYLEQNMFNTSH